MPQPPATASPCQLLTVAQTAAALAAAPATVREWVWRRRCPVVRIGRSVRIPAEWVANYIEAHTTPALQEGKK